MAAAGSADQIDTVYDVLLICSVPIFVLVMTVAIYCVVRFRAKPGDMRDGAPIHGNTRLEVIWVTIPFLMVTALAIYGWIVLDDLEAKQPNELVVNVTGQQFTWTLRVPRREGQVHTTGAAQGPPGRVPHPHEGRAPLLLGARSSGSSPTPCPGLTTKIRLTPDRVGRYQVVCAELCGIGHSTMRQNVRVVPRADVRRLARASRSRPRALRPAAVVAAEARPGGGGGGGADGAQVFASNGCGSCHTLAVAKATGTVGPDLDNVDKPDRGLHPAVDHRPEQGRHEGIPA